MKLIRILVALAVACAGLMLATPAKAAGTSAVSVLHGIPDATVDVWANGEPLLTNFTPGTLTDPQNLPEGSYDLKIVQAGAGKDAEAVVEAKGVTVPAGANITVVAHLDAAGKPSLTPFVNNTDQVAAGQGRLTVRHVAAAPAVDVRANGQPAFTGLENPKEAVAELPAGSVEADVVLAGTSTVAVGPATVQVAEGANTIVYAWGSAEQNNLQLATQVISGMHSAPSGVPAGEGGQLAAQSTQRVGLFALAGALAAGAIALTATRRRVGVRA